MKIVCSGAQLALALHEGVEANPFGENLVFHSTNHWLSGALDSQKFL